MALSNSEFIYEEDGLKLFFSSEFNLKFFKAMINDTIKQFSRTLNLTVQHNVNIDTKYPLTLLYYRIQRDNFLAQINGVSYNNFEQVPSVKISL